jgi:hypothetical protein
MRSIVRREGTTGTVRAGGGMTTAKLAIQGEDEQIKNLRLKLQVLLLSWISSGRTASIVKG